MQNSGKTIKYLLTAVLVAVASVTLYNYRAQVATFAGQIEAMVVPAKPCTTPISFTIGKFDDRFGLTQSQFLDDVAKAGNIWSQVLGHPLFKYDDNGALAINLIYDYRQSATNELQSIDATIQTNDASYKAIKTEYATLKNSYESQKANLDILIQNYDAEKTAYENQVSYWNARGGAPQQQYNALQAQREKVNSDATQVNQATAVFNQTVNNLNAKATQVNQLASQLNISVKNYNTVGASTGLEFDEGEYIRDQTGQRIDIYEFKDDTQLVRVLAHELGHALGLAHVNDAKAIMYRLNQSNSESLTAADIVELKRVCEIQ